MSEVNYKETLNLPKTSFSMKANLTQREPEYLKKWVDEDLYAKIKAKNKGKRKYVLHDGPPYANGHIHIGHALNKILKDIIVKYKTMQGFDSRYVPGWDCHGLPIEHALFKQLGITKDDIDQIKFRRKARAYAEKYVNIQREDFKRLGIFGEWDRPYLTMNFDYQATIIESFKRLYQSGYIYKGEKPIHWCSECETALAEAELEYAEKTSDSVFVSFPLDVKKSRLHVPETVEKIESVASSEVSVLIWTTTPWTLPANVAIAVHPEMTYGVYSIDGSSFIMAKALALQLQDKIGRKVDICSTQDDALECSVRGKDLAGLVCRHPFIDRESMIVLAEYVSDEDGSGCVHIAPGHGQEDYEVGIEYKLPIISPVNEKGQFTADFPDAKGLQVLNANPIVIEILEKNKCLLHKAQMTHSYPHCWRCKSPVIFRATKQWFLNVEHNNLRARLVDSVTDSTKTHWIPGWGKNRILGMLESRPDWCLSRQRLWGVPIPILYCAECEKEYFPATIDEIIECVREKGADEWFRLSAAELLPVGVVCKGCGHGVFKKEHDIIDVWFDSGISHQAVLNNDPELGYPCALYLEGSDQHRGWFQTSLITSMALENKPPFRSVVTHGFTVDGEGKKMSKSAGNVISPQDILKKYGADILRLWVSSCDISQDVRISDEIIKQMADAYRKIRNTFRYIAGNLYDFDPGLDAIAFEDLDEIDTWAVEKCRRLVAEVTADYDSFRFHHIYRMIYNFCVVEMSSFYLDVLKDRMYTAGKKSQIRRSSQTAMHYVLTNLVKISAPILSFTTDELWRNLTFEKDVESVHVSLWPELVNSAGYAQIMKDWDMLRDVRDLINPHIENKRNQNVIGSSLEASLIIYVADENLFRFLNTHTEHLPLVLIVSQVKLEKVDCVADVTAEAVLGFADTTLGLSVSKAPGLKCVRCWNYSESLGSDRAHPDICPKCTQAIT